MIVFNNKLFTREYIERHKDLMFVFEECNQKSHGFIKIPKDSINNVTLKFYEGNYRPIAGPYAVRGLDNALPLTCKDTPDIDGHFIDSHESTIQLLTSLKEDITRIKLFIKDGKHIIFSTKGFCNHRAGLIHQNAIILQEMLVDIGVDVVLQPNKVYNSVYGLVPERGVSFLEDLNKI